MAINLATALGENGRAQGIPRLEPLPSSKPGACCAILVKVGVDANSPLGKTAPRLIQDLLSYDPRRAVLFGQNILTDPAPQYHQDVMLPTLVAKGSCRHKYMTKLDQSQLPAPDRKPERATSYKVASFCHECRCHLLLIVDFKTGSGEQPCPNSQYPLHHFIHHPQSSSRQESSVNGRKGDRWVDQQRFECSSPDCPAVLTIRICAPRITAEWETLLTDEKLVKERAEAVMKLAPDRFEGIAPPLPINVLLNLRSYLNNALRNPEVKKIASLNKKFVTCFGDFGQPCRDLLEYLGFEYDV
jgi:ubiquitin carboxyl-terminal hydrolase 25/28